MRRETGCFVYFVRRADGKGPVKIGCSEYPESRVASLMAWAPYPLTVLATTPGDETLEKRFHANFADQHSHREWFRCTPGLLRTIKAVADGSFDVGSLPAPRRIGHPGNLAISHITRRRIGFQAGLSRTLSRTGYEAPAEISALVDALDKLPADDVEAAIARIQAFTANPELVGVPAPHPWAAERRSAHLASAV